MRPSEFIKEYIFHDSHVEKLEYDRAERQLTLILDLCQWKQSFYKETDPEMQLGFLIFSDVVFYNIEPELYELDSSEILEIRPSDGKSECIKLVIEGLDDVIVINIQSDKVEWKISNVDG